MLDHLEVSGYREINIIRSIGKIVGRTLLAMMMAVMLLLLLLVMTFQ